MYICPDCGGELEAYGHFTITDTHWCPKCECPQPLKESKWLSTELKKIDRSWKMR